jgi:tetratricopeptide (TPR) repeat protein
MLQAAEKAGNNNSLKQVALSNAADLYIHKGDLKKAYKLYKESISIDAADFHSIMGIGWIALVHDKSYSLAEKIFRFIHLQHHAPDALLKLEQLAEARNDSSAQKEWADKFAAQADQPVYGLMYSKYLIDLYTGVLNDPAKALAIAEKEIINRPTAQTYAWYVWALLCNNEKERPIPSIEILFQENHWKAPSFIIWGS